MAAQNYRLIDIDALDPENQFPASLLTPEFPPVPTQTIIEIQNGLRQLLQRGDKAGALRAALENAPYGGDDRGKVSLPSLSFSLLAVLDGIMQWIGRVRWRG